MPTDPQSPYLPFGDNTHAPWYGKDILSVKQFTRADLEYIFGVAHEMRGMVERVGTFDLLKGKILANLFYEPSTRTSSSFTAAMERLGGSVIPINEVKYSSVSKGESLADTVRTLECYADVIVLRHPETGSAAIAAKAAKKPVINAGDGMHQHPTQALLDSMTLLDTFGTLEKRRIAFIGDVLHSRVFRSGYTLFRMLGAEIGVCAPPLLRSGHLPSDMVELSDARAALKWADAVVVLRLQRERMQSGLVPSLADYRQRWAVRIADVEENSCYVLHPGPVNAGVELDAAVVDHARSLIRRQVTNGVFVRVAVLVEALGIPVVQPSSVVT